MTDTEFAICVRANDLMARIELCADAPTIAALWLDHSFKATLADLPENVRQSVWRHGEDEKRRRDRFIP